MSSKKRATSSARAGSTRLSCSMDLVDVRRAGRAERLERAVDVVVGPPHLHVGAEQEPERGGRALVRHADRARVEDRPPVGAERELVVRVPAHDGRLGDAVEHRPQPLGRRDLRDDLHVAARRAVAEEHRAQVVDRQRDDRLEGGEEVPVRAVDAPGAPGREAPGAFVFAASSGRSPASNASTTSRSPLPITNRGAVAERAEPVDRLGHERPGTTSPPTTIASTSSSSTSARTASSAGRLPWMSQSVAIRTGGS